jgi:hypothetical protein
MSTIEKPIISNLEGKFEKQSPQSAPEIYYIDENLEDFKTILKF